MAETVMIEALGQGSDARARALENVFSWMMPRGLEGKRVVVLLGDVPVKLDLVQKTVASLAGAARIDLAVRSLAAYDETLRHALTALVSGRGDLIEMISGEFESLAVPVRSAARELHNMQTQERRFIKQAFVARCLAEADLFVVVRGLELNRFSAVHGVFATVLDCVATKTRTEVLSYAAYGLMGEALLDVWSALDGSFLFGVLDGEETREETFGRSVATGIILAGIDPEELDGYALIVSGGRVSWSPFSASASARAGKSRRGRATEVASNVSLDELRARMPSGFWEKPPAHGMFGKPPVLRFASRPADFDTLVCPTGAIEEGSAGIPLVRRANCVACGWCLKQYAEVSVQRR